MSISHQHASAIVNDVYSKLSPTTATNLLKATTINVRSVNQQISVVQSKVDFHAHDVKAVVDNTASRAQVNDIAFS